MPNLHILECNNDKSLHFSLFIFCPWPVVCVFLRTNRPKKRLDILDGEKHTDSVSSGRFPEILHSFNCLIEKKTVFLAFRFYLLLVDFLLFVFCRPNRPKQGACLVSKNSLVIENANFEGIPLRNAIPLGGGLVLGGGGKKKNSASAPPVDNSGEPIKKKKGRPAGVKNRPKKVVVEPVVHLDSDQILPNDGVSTVVADTKATKGKSYRGSPDDVNEVPLAITDEVETNVVASESVPVAVAGVSSSELATDKGYTPEAGSVPVASIPDSSVPVLPGSGVSDLAWRLF